MAALASPALKSSSAASAALDVDDGAVVMPALPLDGGTFGTGPDTLVVTLSEDRWQGDAQASITLDNKKLGVAPFIVTAIHGQGATEVFTLKGSFGSGSHVVSVGFLNDAWGGHIEHRP